MGLSWRRSIAWLSDRSDRVFDFAVRQRGRFCSVVVRPSFNAMILVKIADFARGSITTSATRRRPGTEKNIRSLSAIPRLLSLITQILRTLSSSMQHETACEVHRNSHALSNCSVTAAKYIPEEHCIGPPFFSQRPSELTNRKRSASKLR